MGGCSSKVPILGSQLLSIRDGGAHSRDTSPGSGSSASSSPLPKAISRYTSGHQDESHAEAPQGGRHSFCSNGTAGSSTSTKFRSATSDPECGSSKSSRGTPVDSRGTVEDNIRRSESPTSRPYSPRQLRDRVHSWQSCSRSPSPSREPLSPSGSMTRPRLEDERLDTRSSTTASIMSHTSQLSQESRAVVWVSQASKDSSKSRRRPSVNSMASSQHGLQSGGGSTSGDRTSESLEKALRHSGSLARRSINVRVLSLPDTLDQALSMSAVPDDQMPNVIAKVDPDNLLEQLPSGPLRPDQMALQRVTFMGTEWLALRLCGIRKDRSLRFCLCAAALQNQGRTTCRCVVVDASEEDGQESYSWVCSPITMPSSKREPCSIPWSLSWIDLAQEVQELADILTNDAALAPKRVASELKRWARRHRQQDAQRSKAVAVEDQLSLFQRGRSTSEGSIDADSPRNSHRSKADRSDGPPVRHVASTPPTRRRVSDPNLGEEGRSAVASWLSSAAFLHFARRMSSVTEESQEADSSTTAAGAGGPGGGSAGRGRRSSGSRRGSHRSSIRERSPGTSTSDGSSNSRNVTSPSHRGSTSSAASRSSCGSSASSGLRGSTMSASSSRRRSAPELREQDVLTLRAQSGSQSARRSSTPNLMPSLNSIMPDATESDLLRRRSRPSLAGLEMMPALVESQDERDDRNPGAEQDESDDETEEDSVSHSPTRRTDYYSEDEDGVGEAAVVLPGVL